MRPSEIIIAHPSSDDKFQALKAFLKALKIKFETADKNVYNPEFVSKILQGDENIKSGKTTKVTLNDIWE